MTKMFLVTCIQFSFSLQYNSLKTDAETLSYDSA